MSQSAHKSVSEKSFKMAQQERMTGMEDRAIKKNKKGWFGFPKGIYIYNYRVSCLTY
jgi:hypothetical protein